MNSTTLTQADFDTLAYIAGMLYANPETRPASDALQKMIGRQRDLGVAPTESVQQVADKLGDPQLAQKFAQQVNGRRAGKVVAGSALPLYRSLADDAKQQPNGDDLRRGPMLPQSFAFRVPGGRTDDVFHARRIRSVGGGGFEVEWLTGERRQYTQQWVAMQLRLDRWRATHDPVTVGGGS